MKLDPESIRTTADKLHTAGSAGVPFYSLMVEAGNTLDNLAACVEECREAVAFFDRVKASSEAEKTAVGVDHWNRLEAACRRMAGDAG